MGVNHSEFQIRKFQNKLVSKFKNVRSLSNTAFLVQEKLIYLLIFFQFVRSYPSSATEVKIKIRNYQE